MVVMMVDMMVVMKALSMAVMMVVRMVVLKAFSMAVMMVVKMVVMLESIQRMYKCHYYHKQLILPLMTMMLLSTNNY